jgi:hypothetical protein
MTQLQFDEEQRSPIRQSATSNSTFVKMLLSTGIVKSESQAIFILLLIAVVSFVVMFLNVLSLSETPTPPPLVADEAE